MFQEKRSVLKKPIVYIFTIIFICLCSLLFVVRADKPTEHQQTLHVLVANTATNSGLITALSKAFEVKNPRIRIEVKTGGALAILDQARQGMAGLVITHYPASEKLFMDEGYGQSRTLIMYKQFALFGPPGYEASIASTSSLLVVLRQLADQEVPFMAPDGPGIQQKLAELWSMAGVKPDWPGYDVTGSSSSSTLRMAAIFGAYAFADMATYLTYRKQLARVLVPIYRDHSALRNYYSAIVVNGKRFNQPNQQFMAQAFRDFLISDEGQFMISQFGENTSYSAIYTPAAHLDLGLKARQASLALQSQQHNLQLMSGLSLILGLLAITATWLLIRTHNLQQTTRLSKERFALAVAGSSDGIWDWGIQSNTAYFSNRVNEILGLPLDRTKVIEPLLILKSLIYRKDRAMVLDTLNEYLDGGSDGVFSTEFRLKKNQACSQPTWVMMRGKVLRDNNCKPVRMSGSFTDITDSKMQKAAFEHQALHDSLTGLPNRVLLHDRLRQTVCASERSNHSFALLMMDLNRFKEVNDTLGHHIGDEVLEHVAQRLKKILRKSDTVARLGGDEFAILLTDANMTYANQVAQKVILSMKKVFELSGHNLYIGGSVGISVYPRHGQDPQTLVQHADVAMYVAKRNNTGVAIYDSAKDQHSMRRLSLEKDLHEAIENNVLELYYQPKVDLLSKTVSGVEALLRWKHPRFGMIPPIEMIELAEQTGLIKPLTKWCMENALRQLAEWQAMGLELDMAINLSIWNLQDRVLLREIADVLERNSLGAGRLELEITESAMIADINRTIEVLDRLSQMGVKLAIDDYGTGFSSLSYLKKLPVDFLKIDKSFVLGMVGDMHDASIVRSTIELAHNIGLKVVAEGVEDNETLTQLAGMGCEIAQGYYFSQPLSKEELPRWMKTSPWGFPMSPETEQQAAVEKLLNTVH